MVKLTKIYTRGGDKGETSLVTGNRVSKSSPIMQAIGSVDEANSALGVARLKTKGKIEDLISHLQNDLFDLGADIATPFKEGGALRITEHQVQKLEYEIDSLNEYLEPLSSFILPGGSEASAHLHLARAITRRAERDLVAAMESLEINPEALKYLNRLSDLLFVLPRHMNNNGESDILWVPAKGQ